MPKDRTRKDRDKVKIVKLTIIPRVMPKGRLLPGRETEKEKTMGRIGQIQGERMVIKPEKKL